MRVKKLASMFRRMVLFTFLFPLALMAQRSFGRWGTGSTAWNMFYPTSRTIYGIDAISENEVWFVGGDMFWDPFAFHYKDGVWTLEKDGPPFPHDSMYDLEMLSATNGWAVGHDGVMYHYDGNTWKETSGLTGLSLFDVDFLSQTDGWAMGGTFRGGGNSVILHYDGTSWSIFQDKIGYGGWLQALDMVSPTDGWAVDDEGYVYHYNGTKWSSVNRPTSKGLYGLDMVAANDGWAVGDDGIILHYDGTNWSSVSVGNEIDFTDIAMVSAEEGWAIGSEGDFFSISSVIMHYKDRNWSRVTNPMPSRCFSAIYMQSPTNGWIGGDYGTVLHYDGSAWIPVPKLTRPATLLHAVDILSPTDVWAVGGWSDFLGTAQGENIIHFDGTLWTDFSVNNVGLNGIDMVSSVDGWAVGTTILHYDGSGWNDVGNPKPITLNGISMLSSTEGWAVGNGGTILHYDGSNWATVSSPTTADFYGIEMLSSTGWILGHVSNATVFLKYDGTSWKIEQLVQDVSLSSFDMLTETSGWAVGDDGKIFQYNAGIWSNAFSPTSTDLDVVRFTPDGDGWAMGYNKVLHWNGAFWDNAATEKPTDEGYIVDIAFIQCGKENVGWAVGRDLWYFKNILPTVVDKSNKRPLVPKSFYMSQNYPNPFNSETIIRYQLPKSCQVKLVIYNLAGQRVATLVDEQQPTGFYSVQWNGKDNSGKNVASGIYLYQLEANESVASRKMFLLR